MQPPRLIILLLFLLPLSAHAQFYKYDTIYRAKRDTMLVHFGDAERRWKQTDYYAVEYEKGYRTGEYEPVKTVITNYFAGDSTTTETFETRWGVSERKFKEWFYDNGQLKIYGTQINQKTEGVLHTYYPNGNRHCICMYHDGKREGLQQVHDSLGRLELRAEYKAGKAHGQFTYYDSLGRITQTEQYVNDKLEGKVVFYHSNGNVWSEQLFKNGRLWEIISNYDSAGNPRDKGTLTAGSGTHLIYNEAGKLIEIDTYKNGRIKHVKMVE